MATELIEDLILGTHSLIIFRSCPYHDPRSFRNGLEAIVVAFKLADFVLIPALT
jgi:hypothetical protein